MDRPVVFGAVEEKHREVVEAGLAWVAILNVLLRLKRGVSVAEETTEGVEVHHGEAHSSTVTVTLSNRCVSSPIVSTFARSESGMANVIRDSPSWSWLTRQSWPWKVMRSGIGRPFALHVPPPIARDLRRFRVLRLDVALLPLAGDEVLPGDDERFFFHRVGDCSLDLLERRRLGLERDVLRHRCVQFLVAHDCAFPEGHVGKA